MKVNNKLFTFKCLKYKKNQGEYFNKELVKRMESAYKLCDGEIDQFCFMLWKEVYHYGYIGSLCLHRFNGTSLPDERESYINLNIERHYRLWS